MHHHGGKWNGKELSEKFCTCLFEPSSEVTSSSILVEPTLRVVGDPGFSPSTVITFFGSGAVGVTVNVLVLHGSEPENK